jgi:Fe-S cluster biogenesis protein NfuA
LLRIPTIGIFAQRFAMKEYNITVVATNNPKIIKLEANHFLAKGNYEYKNIDEAKNSPLAQQLFYLPFIKTVYISGNFIALERFDIVEWDDVKDEVAQQLVEYLNAGEPVVHEDIAQKKEPITVYAEVTPNPAVMKFVANKRIVPAVYEFKNIDEAKDSPLAQELFHFPFVKEVFFDENYVSISKYDMAEWEELTMQLREFIRDFLADGKEVVSAEALQKSKESTEQASTQTQYDDTSQQIIDILEEYVKPAVASDGGNILFQSYEAESKTVNVILQGACSGCPSSTFTLKNGIETMLKNMMGDKIHEVVALNG